MRRILMVLPWVLLAFTTVAHFVPAHKVHDVALNLCLYADCKSSPPVVATEFTIDTGYQHSGLLPLVPIVALAAAAFLGVWRRPRWWRALILVIATVGCGALAFSLLFNLAHMFDKVVTLPAEYVFVFGFLGLGGVSILNPLFAWLLAREKRSA